MAVHESEAIVLKVFDYGESDKIITLLSADFGKITAIAKGAKRSKIRFVGKLEIFTRLNIRFADNKHSDMVRIDEAELLAPYPTLRKDYERYLCGHLVSELLLNWATVNDHDENLYNLAVWTFSHIAEGPPLSSLFLFQLHLLTILGFHLHLRSCTSCDRELDQALPFSFAAENNGLLCSHCIKKDMDHNHIVPLSMGTIKLLEKAREISIDKWTRFHFSKKSLREVVILFKNHNHYLLQRDVISWRQLEEYLVSMNKM